MYTTDEAYYQSIAIIDRIEEERNKLGIGSTKFSLLLGKSYVYWAVQYGTVRGFRLSSLKHIAEKINVSLEYLIYGKKYGKYENALINIKKLAQYTKGKVLLIPRSERSILSLIRHDKQKDLTMFMYFKLEKTFNTNLWRLISE